MIDTNYQWLTIQQVLKSGYFNIVIICFFTRSQNRVHHNEKRINTIES